MLSVVAMFLSFQGPIAAPEPARPAAQDALVIWSAGLGAIAPDDRDRPTLEGLRQLCQWGATKAAEDDESAGTALELVGRWIERPLCLRASLGADGTPSALLAVQCASLDEARADLEDLRALFADAGLELRAAGDEPGTLWAATPEGPLALTARLVDKGAVVSVAFNRPFDPDLSCPAVPVAGVEKPALVVRWDGKLPASGLLELRGKDPEAAKMLALLEGLDLIGPRAPRRTFALVNGAESARTVCVAEGWSRSFAGARGAGPIGRAELRLLPADAAWAWVGNFHLAGLVDLALAIDANEVGAGLKSFAQTTGVDPERDLLGRIGPLAGAYVSRSTGGSALGGLVLFARCQDVAAVRSALDRLLSIAGAIGDPSPMRIESWKQADRQCTSLSFPGTPVPVEPSLSTAGDLLFIALGRAPLRQALDQVDGQRSLLDHPELAKLTDKDLEGLVGLGFLDTPACVQRGYGTLSMLLTGMSHMVRGEGGPELTAFLPTGARLTEGLRPALSRTYLRGADRVTTSVHDRSWVARGTAMLGSPLGEVGPFNPVVAAIAIPKLLSSRLKANESAAIATLRNLTSAQAQFQASTVVDQDGDGIGEYGFFSELTGARPLRGSKLHLEPPVLSSAFAELVADGQGGAVVGRSGYWFQIWLPEARGAALSDCEDEGDLRLVSLDAEGLERRWCAYAWPMEAGRTGLRAFYVDQEGDILEIANTGDGYSGLPAGGGRAPRFDAALEHEGRFSSKASSAGRPAADGNTWRPVL